MSDFYNDAINVVSRPVMGAAAATEFWRKADPKLDEEFQVTMGGFWEHQRAWWSLPNFIHIMVGGYGAGKTLALCKRMVSLALTNNGCPVACVSPTFPIARHTTILTINSLLAGKRSLLGASFWYNYNASSHEFSVRYHGRQGKILILSGDNPSSLRGPNLAAAGIDEPFIQSEDVFHQMVARVRHPQAVQREISITGTPEQLNWGYDLCVGDLGERHDVGVVTASTRLNLALDGGYVGRLEGSFTDKAAEAFIGGKFVNLSAGQVYYGYDPFENLIDLDMPVGAEMGVGMDFNVNPMAAAVFWKLGNHVHFIEDIEFPNADTEFLCSYLVEKYWADGLRKTFPDASGRARSTAAPGGRTDFYYIQKAGLSVNCHSTNPPIRDRYNAVNGKLKPFGGRVSITISPSCKRLKKYLGLYSHELLTKQQSMSHLLDAFSYPIAYLFPVITGRAHQTKLKGH